MLIGKPADIPSSEITSRDDYNEYFNRRRFLRSAAAAGAAVLGADARWPNMIDPRIAAQAGTKLQTVKSPLTTTGEQLTSYRGHYALQQLLRVWRGQGSAGEECRRPADAAVDA